MAGFMDLAGAVIGRLTVLSRAPVPGKPRWLCRCSCGNEKIITAVHLRLQKRGTRSCGCLGRELRKRPRTHGMSKSREFCAWQSARTRCYRPSYRGFHSYGGRGITMCDEWRNSFERFYADMGPCPEGRSLDRIDVNGPYSKANCRWATAKEQQRNTRFNRLLTHAGRTLTMTEWAEIVGLRKTTLHERLRHGWTVERALTQPLEVHRLTSARAFGESSPPSLSLLQAP